MNELTVRMNALDPEAARALQVITHFDSLVASRAGLQSIVRGAAALAGCAVRLTDPGRRLTVRVLPDGVVSHVNTAPDPAWPSEAVTADGAVLCLERLGPVSAVEAMVLERAAGAACGVLERTRTRRVSKDPALLEVVLDPNALPEDRLAAARRLGLPEPARAVALDDGTSLVVPAHAAISGPRRAGVGPAVAIVDLPQSWAAARTALRLTARGGEDDPGPRIVHAEKLGALSLLVQAADDHPEPVPDVRALNRAAATAPWVLATLEASAYTTSLRDAARLLQMHHSTLQDRLAHAETALGWDIREPHGRLRLQMALVLRRADLSRGAHDGTPAR